MDAFLSLTPAALLMLVVKFRRVAPRGAVWLAAALAMSAVGDLWATAANGAWYPSYVWLPFQMAFAVKAVSEGHEWIAAWACLLLLGFFDVMTATGPDLAVTAVGSSIAVCLAMGSGHRLAVPVLIYFGLGSVLYLSMVAAMGTEAFMPLWWAYQGCRVVAWLALAEIVRHCWFRYRVGRATVDPHHVERVSLLRFLGAR